MREIRASRLRSGMREIRVSRRSWRASACSRARLTRTRCVAPSATQTENALDQTRGQYPTVPHSTPQYPTVPHSTTQDHTGPHSTPQHTLWHYRGAKR
eukprot:611770-Rhodomonas_salina.2